MTAQLLTSELSSLIQESKRKNQDIKNVAEKSLSELKALSNRSDAQLASDLKHRPFFVKPFLLACATRNPKLAGSGIICLQRLIVSNAFPNECLEELLEAFRECSSLALDIQLKVLQALPSLLQNYAGPLRGKLLVTTFQLCFLLHGSKTIVVSNTAAAALQQLVALTFDKVSHEDGISADDEPSTDIASDDGSISVRKSALDAYQLLNDICLLTEGRKAKFLHTATLSQNFGLELLESVLSDHADTVTAHPEQIQIFRRRLLPLIIRILSEKSTFSTTARAMRIVQLIISHLLFALASECEMVLSLLNHMLDPDAAILWKRALCLEVFRGIHSDSTLVRSIYSHYDEQEEKRNIIRDHLATLVRLASEKPAAIGLGKQSSTSSHSRDNSAEQTSIQPDKLISSIGAVVSMTESEAPGINTKWSNMRVPCIEQLDKSEAPTIPATYIYGLALTCINNFSEGLAKFLLPFTLPLETKGKRKPRTNQEEQDKNGSTDSLEKGASMTEDKSEPSKNHSIRSRNLPINPLKLESHVLYSQIFTSGQMVEHCWPALLATYSTFLNATLDSDYYHALIRSFQRFTQVAGLLDLSTPRDAFLTTLSKHSVPLASITSLSSPSAQSSTLNGGFDGLVQKDGQIDINRDPNTSPSIFPTRRQQPLDLGNVKMDTRNLLCLRALLNLGIALGPVLQRSWLIILETLQQADLILAHAGASHRQVSGHSKQASANQTPIDELNGAGEFSLEVAAVKTAAARMLESTRDLPTQAFIEVIECLCSLLRNIQDYTPEVAEDFNDDLLSPLVSSRKHRRLPSLFGMPLDEALKFQGNIVVIDRIGEISMCNIMRFLGENTAETGWDILTEALINLLSLKSMGAEARNKAAIVLNEMVIAAVTSSDHSVIQESENIRKRGLVALLEEITSLLNEQKIGTKMSKTCDLEIHILSIESLQSILEQCGDSLSLGWDTIFTIIASIFDGSVFHDGMQPDIEPKSRSRSPKLLRTSFGPLQLICSDFLSSVPSSCLLMLLDTLYAFCSQDQDLNVSLTTITFFRNVSDFLLNENENINFSFDIAQCKTEVDLIRIVQVDEHSNSITALWLCLLLRLMRMAHDDRLEVRHSALHTFFRIFDACSDQMSASAWRICYQLVLLEMLRNDETSYETTKSSQSSHPVHDHENAWNHTAIIIVGGISTLSIHSIETTVDGRTFTAIWSLSLKYFAGLLDRQALSVSTAVFNGMTKMLAAVEDTAKVGKALILKVWETWKNGLPVLHANTSRGQRGQMDNEESSIAYLDCLHHIYRLVGREMLPEQVKDVTERLHSCVINSDANTYGTDIDNLTLVQKYILESLKMIPTEDWRALSNLVDSVTDFVVMAYDEKSVRKGQTYVALSKSSMDLLESIVKEHVEKGQIQGPDLLIKAISALAIPLKLKYKWKKDGRNPAPWRKATTTALAILEVSVPALHTLRDSPFFWDKVLDINDGILAADCASCNKQAEISQDQDFDIDAFSQMRRLLLPWIRLSKIPDGTRRKYTDSLFRNSIIHNPHPDDLARPGQELLQGLRSTHIGRTQDIPPSPRSKLSYMVLDDLFSLVAVDDGSSEHLRLAQAAAPFLILRVGITLKAYVLDQPLRGRMPQPLSQKQELLYILRKFTDLDSEPRAIPDATGITSEHKKHLHRLYPLIVRATTVAWRDEEVTQGLKEVLEALGQDFGV